MAGFDHTTRNSEERQNHQGNFVPGKVLSKNCIEIFSQNYGLKLLYFIGIKKLLYN
jgi:hypothetical protein